LPDPEARHGRECVQVLSDFSERIEVIDPQFL
jgi:hypothetical protein